MNFEEPADKFPTAENLPSTPKQMPYDSPSIQGPEVDNKEQFGRTNTRHHNSWLDFCSSAEHHLIAMAWCISIFCLMHTLRFGELIQAGGDEGPELAKAQLIANGHQLYKHVFSDQPPLITYVYSFLHQSFGADPYYPRLLSLLSTCCLLYFISITGGRLAGRLGAILGPLYFLAIPPVLLLSVSAMQELPVLATGFCGLYLFALSEENDKRNWIIGAMLLALSIGIKLTGAIFFLFAIFTQLVQYGWIAESKKKISLCFAVVTATLSVIILYLGVPQLNQIIGGHINQGFLDPNGRSPSDFGLEIRKLVSLSDLLILAGIAPLTLASFKIRSRMTTAIVVVCTILAMTYLIIYRPFWDYYWANVGLAVSFLALLPLKMSLMQILESKHRELTGWELLRHGFLLSLVLSSSALALYRLPKELQNIARLERVFDSALLRELEHYSPGGFVYITDPVFNYHSNLLCPPELAVITHKRFWSGFISTGKIIDRLSQSDVKVIVLRAYGDEEIAASIIKTGFRLVSAPSPWRIYLLKKNL